jgi:hypothetical protein
MILEPRFDHVREAVLGLPRDGFFIIGTRADVANSRGASLTYELIPSAEDVSRMLVVVDFHGIFVGTDSRPVGPVIDVPPDAPVSLLSFTKSDFPQRNVAATEA